MQGPKNQAAKAWFHQYFRSVCWKTIMWRLLAFFNVFFLGTNLQPCWYLYPIPNALCMVYYTYIYPPKNYPALWVQNAIHWAFGSLGSLGSHTLAGKDAKKRSRLNSALRPGRRLGDMCSQWWDLRVLFTLCLWKVHGPKSFQHVKLLTDE